MALIVQLAGSICLLLWGSYTVRKAVDKAYATRIGATLSHTGWSFPGALLCGALAAVAFQSATATILLSANFVSSGLMTAAMALVIFLGADIGSAVAVRILFLDLSLLSPLLLIAGLVVDRTCKSWRHRQLSRILVGIGLILLSIQLIKLAVAPVIQTPISDSMLEVLQGMSLVALVMAALLTWLVHSSVAVVLVIASMTQIGFLPVDLSATLVLGANIGAGLIALLLVNRQHADTHAAVFANFLLRSLLGLVVFAFSTGWLPLLERVSTDPGLQVIYLHLGFNLLLGFLFAPLSAQVIALVHRLLTFNQVETIDVSTREPGAELDPGSVGQTPLALACARREAVRLADDTESLFRNAMKMFEVNDRSTIDSLVAFDEVINTRNKAIHKFLADVRRNLKPEAVGSDMEAAIDDLLEFSSTMENIGDVVTYDLARLAIKRISRQVDFSADGSSEISEMHGEVLHALQLLISNLITDDKAVRKKIRKQLESARQLGHESIDRHRYRVSQRNTSSVSTSSIHQDSIRDLMQVISLLTSLLDRRPPRSGGYA